MEKERERERERERKRERESDGEGRDCEIAFRSARGKQKCRYYCKETGVLLKC